MASLFKLRKSEPGMARPFRAPLYPLFPAFALIAAVVCLVTMAYYNQLVAGLFVGIVVLGFVYFSLTKGARKEWVKSTVETGAGA